MNQRYRYEQIKSVQINPTTKSFPICLSLDDKKNQVFMGLSDYQITNLSLETLQQIWSVNQAHSKKINGVCQIQDKIMATCSNDASIKLYDSNSGLPIAQLKNIDQTEFYSIASSQYIIAAGSEGIIRFYDIRTMKLRSSFEESQNDEVTSVQFNPRVPTELLACSLDGILVIYDLTQSNEEESLNNMIRFEEPLEYCNYIDQDTCYSISTTQTIDVINQTKGEKLKSVKSINHDEFAEQYLVGVLSYQNDLNYFIGNKQNLNQIQQFDMNQKQSNLLCAQSSDQIRHINYIKQHDSFLLYSEDGTLEILQPKQEIIETMDQEIMDTFLDENYGDDQMKLRQTRSKK